MAAKSVVGDGLPSFLPFIHRSAWKGRSPKSAFSILHNLAPNRDKSNSKSLLRAGPRHYIWTACIKIRPAACRASGVSASRPLFPDLARLRGKPHRRCVVGTETYFEGQRRCRNRRWPTRSRSRRHPCRPLWRTAMEFATMVRGPRLDALASVDEVLDPESPVWGMRALPPGG